MFVKLLYYQNYKGKNVISSVKYNFTYLITKSLFFNHLDLIFFIDSHKFRLVITNKSKTTTSAIIRTKHKSDLHGQNKTYETYVRNLLPFHNHLKYHFLEATYR